MKLLRNKDIKQFFAVLLAACLLLTVSSIPLIAFSREWISEHTDAAALYSTLLFTGILIFIAVVFFAFFYYFWRQQKILDAAGSTVKSFITGDMAGRLESEEEGSLSRLFSLINLMATSLNTHIKTEKQTKNFLKQTIEDVSHQLKTPLASLRMCNEIIRAESRNEVSVRRFSEKSELALAHMEVLIQNLLKISRFDAGVMQLNMMDCNLENLLKDAASGYEIRIERERKSIDLAGNANIQLFCDRDWIMEAVGNLIKNALDHTNAGGLIQIRWKESPVITQITVQDNGSGMHTEDLPHIFKRFYRSRFSKNTQGIGLGLALVKSIVEAHNGTITVSSELGKGSIFTLDFLKLTNL